MNGQSFHTITKLTVLQNLYKTACVYRYLHADLQFAVTLFTANKLHYENIKLHRLTERDSRRAHFSAHKILNNFARSSLNFRDPHFGIFWGLGLLLG